MTTTQQREHIRLGGVIERAKPGVRLAVNGIEYDHKFIASTELLASDHGVILADAWHWDRYMQRPRWIANHDLGAWSGKITEVSLGRGVYVATEDNLPANRVGPSGKGMVVYVRYATTPFAQEVRALYEQGGLDDVSVRWDWRTEVVRNPYEEEVQKFGPDLFWVCEHADLVELSAVLLGADAGAQMLRNDVMEAFERCRSKNIALPELERIVRGSRTVTPAPSDKLPGALSKPFAGYANFAQCVAQNQDQPHPVTYCAGLVEKKHSHADVDINAAADALNVLKAPVGTLGDLHDAAGPPRQEITDGVTALQNLSSVTPPPLAEDGGEPEPSDVAVALGAFNEALGRYDLSHQAEGKALTDLRDAVTLIAKALGLGDVPGVDIARVLADRPDAVERLRKAVAALPSGSASGQPGRN